ncbi:DUF1573 domain-containing protein [Candidatus Poribacteria bacterium]|nr:DUF1573 domain-containing protein [Candidatus Poribacteria bacterium]
MKFIVNIWLLLLMLIPTFLAADTPHTCGAASLYNLARILGIEVELEETDKALKKPDGKSLVNNFAELVASAKDLGIELQGVKLTYKHLQTFDTPIIAHLKTTFEDENPSESGSSIGHFIVVEHAAENWVRIFDSPKDSLFNTVVVVSRDRFLDLWTGRALVISDKQQRLKQPNIHVSPLIIDFGKETKNKFAVPIQLENRSSRPVKIINIESNCNCTVIKQPPNVLSAGSKAEFNVDWDVNALNRSTFTTIHVQTDAPQRPHHFISMGVIREFSILFIPENIYLNSTGTSNIKRTVELQNLRETFAKIQEIKSSQTWIHPVLRSSKVVGPWKAATIELNFETGQIPGGEINETLTVKYVDGEKEQKTLTLPITGKVDSTYTLFPNRFFFGRINAGKKNKKKVVLKNMSGTAFRIKKVETDVGTAQTKPLKDGNGFEVHLTLPPILPTGILKSEVRVHTTHPKIGLIKVPVFAVISK